MSGDIFRRSIILSERMSSAISTIIDAGRDTALVCIMLTALSAGVRWEKS
jgi:hypothetical protein